MWCRWSFSVVLSRSSSISAFSGSLAICLPWHTTWLAIRKPYWLLSSGQWSSMNPWINDKSLDYFLRCWVLCSIPTSNTWEKWPSNQDWSVSSQSLMHLIQQIFLRLLFFSSPVRQFNLKISHLCLSSTACFVIENKFKPICNVDQKSRRPSLSRTKTPVKSDASIR